MLIELVARVRSAGSRGEGKCERQAVLWLVGERTKNVNVRQAGIHQRLLKVLGCQYASGDADMIPLKAAGRQAT